MNHNDQINNSNENIIPKHNVDNIISQLSQIIISEKLLFDKELLRLSLFISS